MYFHVIEERTAPGHPAATIDEQIAVLNLTYSGFHGGHDTASASRSPGRKRRLNDAWFEQKTFADEFEMKSSQAGGRGRPPHLLDGW